MFNDISICHMSSRHNFELNISPIEFAQYTNSLTLTVVFLYKQRKYSGGARFFRDFQRLSLIFFLVNYSILPIATH